MNKTLLATAILGTIFLQGCSTYQMEYATDILLTGSDYDRGITTPTERKKLEQEKIEADAKAEAERKEKRAKFLANKEYCDSQSDTPSTLNDRTFMHELITEKPGWKDPFSLKITKLDGASPRIICHFEKRTQPFSFYSYQGKVPKAVGIVYAKNGYGAYGGATEVVVFKDNTVWVESK